MLRIGSMLDPTISFKISCKDSLYTLAKIFCLQTMHTGVNKQVPNNSSIEFYQTVKEGIRIYHNTVLSGVEVGHSKLALLPKVLLNKNNITTTQFALQESYCQDDHEENPYKLVQSRRYYPLLYDGIQKFSKELNGVFIRSLSSAWNSLNIPWLLTEIERGSLSATKLVQHIQTISQVKPTKNNAYSEVPKLLKSLLEKNSESDLVIP